MTLSVTHPFVSAKSDGVDATLVQPSNWNAGHTLTMSTAKVLGRLTASTGVVEELPITGTGNVVLSANSVFSGNIGIGRTAATYPLEVQGTNGQGVAFYESTNSVTQFMGAYNSAGLLGTITNHPVAFYVNNAEVGRFTPTGTSFLVGKTASAIGTAGFQSSGATGQTDVTVNNSECMNIVRLGSNGTMIRFFHTDASTVIGSISTSGGTTTSYNTSSDESFKENIKAAEDVGHLIDAAPVKEFDWRETGEKQMAGFVAQDLLDTLAPIVPGLVNMRDDGKLEYDPSKLVPLLWKELQSMRARVAALEVK